ncbi:MAG: hypothetical protein KBS63_01580 [Clostridiales bacterium]|nr:hypothetical protein [Candidatus Crickella caballi]
MKNTLLKNRILAGVTAILLVTAMVGGEFAIVFAEESGYTTEEQVMSNPDEALPDEEASDPEEPELDDSSAGSPEVALDVEGGSSDEELMTEEEYEEAEPASELTERIPRKLVSSIKGSWLKSGDALINVRDLGKQSAGEYNVLQGSCSDGEEFVYCIFNRKSTDGIKIVKFRMAYDPSKPSAAKLQYVSSSGVLAGAAHGNDMAYVKDPAGDGHDKILIITSTTGDRPSSYVDVFDPETMKEVGGITVKYWKDLGSCDQNCYPSDSTVAESKRRTLASLAGDKHGFSSIDYNEEKGLVVTTNKTDRDIMIFKPVWKGGNLSNLMLIRYIVQNKKNACSQGMICDEDYIYTCWSAQSGVLSGNILQIYDWQGNHVGDRKVSDSYELESMFCMKKGGKDNYFASFHHSYTYKYQEKQSYKVKWKKVTRKVKWKRIKKKGKWKWKYKKKRVWKYKTKYKMVDKTSIHRNAYCMSIGELTVDGE